MCACTALEAYTLPHMMRHVCVRRWAVTPSGVLSRSDPTCHDLKQFPHAKRFGEKIIGPARLGDAACSDMSREENHRNVPGVLTPLHLSAQVPPVFALQQDIEQDQMGRVAFH